MPDAYRRVERNHLLRHLYLQSGDALVFSEALVHGTCAVTGSGPRRAVFARYINSHSYYRRPTVSPLARALPATPNHTDGAIELFRPELLSHRQRQIVCEPAYARGRGPIQAQAR